MKLFAGLDVSTQGCKLVIIDTDLSKVVFVTNINYDNDLPQYNTKNGVIQGLPEECSESDPNMWIDAVNMTFQRAKEAGIMGWLHLIRMEIFPDPGQSCGTISQHLKSAKYLPRRSVVWKK
ncbi:MAG: hypothetical protein ACTSR2_15265 [Candidatus Hodarchaeales archaeon]